LSLHFLRVAQIIVVEVGRVADIYIHIEIYIDMYIGVGAVVVVVVIMNNVTIDGGLRDGLQCGLELPEALVLLLEFIAQSSELFALSHARADGGAAIRDGAHDAALERGEIALGDAGVLGSTMRGAGEGGNYYLAHGGGVVVGRELRGVESFEGPPTARWMRRTRSSSACLLVAAFGLTMRPVVVLVVFAVVVMSMGCVYLVKMDGMDGEMTERVNAQLNREWEKMTTVKRGGYFIVCVQRINAWARLTPADLDALIIYI